MSTKTRPQRGPAEDRERAVETAPHGSRWRVALLWVGVGLALGAVSLAVMPGSVSPVPDRLTLAHYFAALIFNVASIFFVTFFAARQTLALRGLRELWKSEWTRTALNRLGLPLLVSVAAFGVVTVSGQITPSMYTALLEIGTVFSVYRALTTAYTAHYFEFVASSRELREHSNDLMLKSRPRRIAERLAVTLGVRYPKDRLSMPLVQTAIVCFLFQSVVAVVWMVLGGNPEAASASDLALRIAPSAMTVASVVIWALWHLVGGIGRITRISEGRSMKSYGWKHADLLRKP